MCDYFQKSDFLLKESDYFLLKHEKDNMGTLHLSLIAEWLP